MKKLLIVTGASIHVVNYVKLIDGYFDDILVVTDKEMTDLPCKQVFMDFSLHNPLRLLPGIKQLKGIIQAYQPSIIHLQQAATHSFMAVKAAKGFDIPIVLTPWGSDILLNPQRGFFYKQMVKNILKSANYITAFSKYFGKAMVSLVSDNKLNIYYVKWGIDTEKATIGIKENIIYSNRLLEPLYRIDKIIEAYAALSLANRAKWRLVIAGIGSEMENLKSLCQKLGVADRVEFCCWLSREENYKNFSKAAIYVSIPISDSMPISVQEAMLHGCLPVLSKLPANREIVAAPAYGYIVEDVNNDFLSSVINLDFEHLIVHNAEKIRQTASLPVARQGFINVYEQALSRVK